MQELINKIAEKAGITEEQAQKAFEAVKEHAASMFNPSEIMEALKGKAGGLMEDVQNNENVQKAENMFGDLKDKLSGLFNQEK